MSNIFHKTKLIRPDHSAECLTVKGNKVRVQSYSRVYDLFGVFDGDFRQDVKSYASDDPDWWAYTDDLIEVLWRGEYG